MKVLTTGANGFIGKHLCNRLEKNGIKYIPLTSGSDVRNNEVFNALLNQGITHVIHLAAKNFVPESWEKPTEYIHTNFIGTLNALEFCRKEKASLLYISSYMYGIPKQLPIKESHPITALNPYALSKKMAEDACEFYSSYYGVSSIILRPFNVYGPGQKSDFLIPHIIHQAVFNTEIKVKDIEPKRDYIFVSDVVDAILAALKNNYKFEVFNIGSGISYSVKEIINMIQKITGTNKPVICSSETRMNEIMDVQADILNLYNQTGWKPGTDMLDGLKICINEITGE